MGSDFLRVCHPQPSDFSMSLHTHVLDASPARLVRAPNFVGTVWRSLRSDSFELLVDSFALFKKLGFLLSGSLERIEPSVDDRSRRIFAGSFSSSPNL